MFMSSFRLVVILDSFRTKDTYLKVSRKLQEWLDFVFELHQCPGKIGVVHIQGKVSHAFCVLDIFTFSWTGSYSDKLL